MRARLTTFFGLALAVAACGGDPGQELLSEDAAGFRAYVDTLCSNYRPEDGEKALLEALAEFIDEAPTGDFQDRYERAVVRGAGPETRRDFDALGLTYCARALG